MIDAAFIALVQAWITIMIAATLFASAFALSGVWDTAVYLRALQNALSLSN